jgi:multisubunit Na+/H+ antiporter MnhC subunit
MAEKKEYALKEKAKFELKRYLPFLLVAGIFLVPDKASLVVLYAIGVVALVLILTHGARNTIFPYIHMSHLTEKAEENPIASALVFASIIYLMVKILDAVMLILK